MSQQLKITTNKINSAGYKVLGFLSMLYLMIMLFNMILTNRYVGNDLFFVLGGSFTSPFIFILDDIIAEIYGYKIARSLIIFAFFVQTLFVVLCQIVIQLPHPAFFNFNNYYEHVLGPTLIRINISGFLAYIFANLINSYILTRWKVLMQGKHFWMRSIGSSTFSEALYSFIAILMMELQSIPFQSIIQVVAVSFLIKFIYTVVFSLPSNYCVNSIKKRTGIDVYDFPMHLTPFTFQESLRND